MTFSRLSLGRWLRTLVSGSSPNVGLVFLAILIVPASMRGLTPTLTRTPTRTLTPSITPSRTPTPRPTPMTIQVPAGDVSALVAAIVTANRTSIPDTIVLGGGTYLLTGTEPAGGNGLPGITTPITVQVAGETATIARDPTAPPFRIFHVLGPGILNIRGVALTGGSESTGGAILNRGEIRLEGCSLSGNSAGQNGGAIENSGTAFIIRSSITGNSAGGSGGGIHNSRQSPSTQAPPPVPAQAPRPLATPPPRGRLTVVGSTVHDNTAAVDGGGLLNTANTTLSSSTISSNGAGRSGGGIANLGSGARIELRNSTVSGNSAQSGGGVENSGSGVLIANNATLTRNAALEASGGISSAAGSATDVANSIIAQNIGSDCRGHFESLGFNLIGNGGPQCQGFDVAGDRVGTPAHPIDPRLEPLTDNGGSTETHALLSGSPAIGKGNPGTPGFGICEGADQRGFPRGVDGPGEEDTSACDIGAFEFGMRIVNDFFQRPSVSNRRTSATGCGPGFAGRYRFDAKFTNKGDRALSDLIVEVETLTNGNLVRLPVGLAGVGARLEVSKVGGFSDGLLEPGESVIVPFEICLRTRDDYALLIDVLGVVH